MPKRPALSLQRIVDAAVAVADRGGLDQVSMRNVGRELGVEAMSLYHHVANKDALIDAMVDRFFTLIERPRTDDPWRAATEGRAASLRAELRAHPWALGLIESRRAPNPNVLAHHEAVLANLRANGFDLALAGHAFSVVDAYVFGFVLTELNLPFEPGESAEEFVAQLGDALGADHPHMVELVSAQVTGRTYDYGDEFEFGLELILDGLERHLAESS